MKHVLPVLLFAFAVPAAIFAQSSANPSKGEPTNAAEAAAQKAKADAELDARYQALIAKLPPDQQAWERVLQDQLGSFYLPIHKREKIAGRSNAWDFVQDDPKLPRVLLIGDSVSRGYTQAVRKEMAGKANVHRAPANCGPTASGLKNIEVWLGDGKWDVIHFNFGIHDRATPIADYTQRLEQLIERMQKTGAKLVWASTTPIPDTPDGKQTAASIIERNHVAAEVMTKHGIATDDLFAAITPHLATMQNPNDVHFNAQGYDFLGQTVAKAIEAALRSSDGFTPLFNGKDLSGWDGDPKLWKVENGIVTGINPAPDAMANNSFLIWRGGKVKDFELRATIRVLGDNNSGIQYRSRELPEVAPWVITGYQCDIHPAVEHCGMTYEERGRGIFGLNGINVLLDPDGVLWKLSEHAPVKVDVSQWNEYTIIANGNHLIHQINGQTTSELLDHDEKKRALEGLLAIQLHRGNPNRVEIKALRLKVLPESPLILFDASKLPAGVTKIEKPRTSRPQGTGPVVPTQK